ncbi:MAG: MinD/ParA family protein [Lachnospiraceae bacterium]|nr:MinD/ParA family protein [Lachnospiraceae bacterium]
MDQAQQLRNVIKEKNIKTTPKIKSNARVLTITSGKGGVGKSNLAVNLAIQLRKFGKRVIIFDADIGLANVEVMFGTNPNYNLNDMIYHGKSLKDIVSEGPMGVGFISGGSGIAGLSNLTEEQINLLLRNFNELDDLADVIIIDTGAGISDSVLKFVANSPEVLLVTTPEPSSITDSYSLLKVLYQQSDFKPEQTKVQLVANKVLSAVDGDALYDKLQLVVSRFLGGKLEYLGMIPMDMTLERAVRKQKVVSLEAPSSNAAKAYEILADNLMHHEHKTFTMKRGISQFFSNFFNK